MMTVETKRSFTGRWLVSEYVFNPDGSFAGINRQQRAVEQLEDGILRVTQHCEPEPGLAGHRMDGFRGHWVFDLRVEGAYRHYLGVDVIGLGTVHGDGVMTGQGSWPRFGYDFTSFSILVTPECQFTGGRFLDGGELIANIVGVATPEDAAGIYPVILDLAWAVAAAERLDEPNFNDWAELRNEAQTRICRP